ncbi:hypothetical protein [Bremerella alba]|uniref:Uncharacterized protein n=1 Tax=Bremerella alba TaxID=980252 RepID=A0A7V8V4J4_9BACT|nr:hypothetical protein [Bremerella alba]MBA2114814.1 hypothetical protein [Bremerella alba]
MNFDPYPTEVAELIQTAPLCPLGPGNPDRTVFERLQAIQVDSLSNKPVQDTEMARACISGLWLLWNYLDESHTISQDLPSSTGSYWHAIMHRREPDYGNGKYWFRRTGDHPAMEPLAAKANLLASDANLDSHTQFLAEPNWDPMAMVDACEAVSRGKCANELLLRKVAQLEWETLFETCYSRAF